MMRTTRTPFDGSSKWGWLGADLNGFLYTLIPVFLTVVLCCERLFGEQGHDPTKQRLLGYVLFAIIASFFIVFVLRRNFTVIGPRRSFRYICRWL